MISIGLESKQERDNAFRPLLVPGISLGELLQHQAFFKAKFDPETQEHQQEAYKSSQMSLHEYSCKEHGEHPAVDGVADESVRTALDEFMSFFQRHHPAPVPAEDHSGP